MEIDTQDAMMMAQGWKFRGGEVVVRCRRGYLYVSNIPDSGAEEKEGSLGLVTAGSNRSNRLV